jgi:zinc-ribbon domain/Stage II sporulation protein M
LPYCPKCGKEVLATDQFCLNCGESLERLSGRPESPAPTQLVPPVPAMDTSNLYLIGDEGLLKVGTTLPLVALPIILGAALGLLVVIYSDFGNWVAISVVLALIIGPIVGAYRARRLSRFVGLTREELASRPGVRAIPWSSIQSMRIVGRRLSFKTATGWYSTTIDRTDADRLAQKASSALGGNFAVVPEGPPRFSPTMKFFLLFAAIFLITEGITFAASLTPFFAGEQEHYTNLYNNVEAGLGPTIFQQWSEIFLNNVQVALAGFVPAFGSLILSLSSYNTGRVIQAAAIHFGVSPSTFLTLLFILPHTWVEEVSYPLAGALGLYMFTWRHQSYAEFSNWRTRGSTKVALGFACVALILAVAAALEVSEPTLSIGALLLWVPVVIGALYAYLKLKSRIAAALS